MIKYLPAIFRKILLVFFLFLIISVSLFNFAKPISAQVPTPTGVPEGSWVRDNEVTFVGKVAVRSGEFLDWTMANYYWSSVSSGGSNPLASFWATIRNIVYAFFALFVLITAFIIIVTRGQNITITRFIPRFFIIILLVTFSFSLVQFIYQIFDIIQGFFLKNSAGNLITQKDLLYVGFDYAKLGYRVFGAPYDESVFVSLLLVKLTALTYYVMTGILIIRKIILWFFIIISPIFPLLLLYSPVRNTAKIWIGEFFRWLLYAPLFTIFLSGLVHLWGSSTSSVSGIPLKFNFAKPEEYKTAISILLGGPGQAVGLNNSINNSDTFAFYVVALLMLWVVIILPFLLLQIFLDYLNNFSFGESALIKQIITSGSALVNRAGPGISPPSSPQPAGFARPLPFIPSKIIPNKIEIPEIRATEATVNAQVANMQARGVSSDILRLVNLSIPTMRDIAKYETALLSSDISRHQEVARVHEALEGIANPRRISVPVQRQNYSLVQERLKQEAQGGDPLATSILSAANTVSRSFVETRQQENARIGSLLQRVNNPENTTSLEEREKLNSIKTALLSASQNGDSLATSVLSTMKEGKMEIDETLREELLKAKERGNTLAASILDTAGILETKAETGVFPTVNRVQAVSIDDYEAVKKIWQENYQKLEPPRTIDGKQISRKDWIKADIDKISDAINFLTSPDPQNIKKGMDMVSAILPFLLIGGFAQTEVIAYLKAKLEAAKSVIGEISQKEEEETTMVEASKKKDEKPKEMKIEEQVPREQTDLEKDTDK